MKKIVFAVALSSILFSCEEKRVCIYNDKEVPCGYQDLYNKLMAHENKINESFESNSLTLEQKLALREKWLELYNAKKDSIAEAFKLLGSADFPIDQLYEMRKGEVEQFKKSIEDKANLQVYLKSIEIIAVEKDTAIVKDEKPKKYLLWFIQNNSDKTIKSIAIEKQVVRNGEKTNPPMTTTHFFTKDQISPTPETDGLATLTPGSTLTLPFELEENIKIEAQISAINFE